jgi:hypothetical protein
MRVLLDECVTRYIKRDLVGHDVRTVQEAGFKGLKNGALLQSAANSYDVLLTVDRNVAYQQNLDRVDIAVLVLSAHRNTYAALLPLIPRALRALERIQPGEIIEIQAS